MIQQYAELLRHYRRLVATIFFGIVGGVGLISAFFLFVMPLYTATTTVSLLPTQSELAYSDAFSRGGSMNPANLMSETHIEYLLSREVAQGTVDRLIAEYGTPEPAMRSGFRAVLGNGFRLFKNTLRQVYNVLNSGKHVPIDAYTDAVLTLQDSIDAEMVEGTYILELSVTWDSPELAAAAANMLADVYVARAREQARDAALQLEQDLTAQLEHNSGFSPQISSQIEALRLARATGFDVLRVVDRASVPIYPSFPKVVINVLIAIAAAILLSIFALVTIDTFSGKVTTRGDLARLLGGLALPTSRPDERRRLAETARLLRLHADVNGTPGAVLSLDSDRDADLAAALFERALWPGLSTARPGAAAARAVLFLDSRRRDAQAAGRAWMAVGAESLAEPPAATTKPEAATPAAPGVVSLGGAGESFSLGGLTMPAWLVLVMRPGRIAEAELQRVAEEWRQRGVPVVFGMLLKA